MSEEIIVNESISVILTTCNQIIGVGVRKTKLPSFFLKGVTSCPQLTVGL